MKTQVIIRIVVAQIEGYSVNNDAHGYIDGYVIYRDRPCAMVVLNQSRFTSSEIKIVPIENLYPLT